MTTPLSKPLSALHCLLFRLVCSGSAVLLIDACTASDPDSKPKTAAAPANLPSGVPASRRDVSFVRDVKPILELRCLSCHRSATPSGFSLESRQRAFAVGPRGPRIRPGAPEKSLLFIYSATLNGTVIMPMVGERLSNRGRPDAAPVDRRGRALAGWPLRISPSCRGRYNGFIGGRRCHRRQPMDQTGFHSQAAALEPAAVRHPGTAGPKGGLRHRGARGSTTHALSERPDDERGRSRPLGPA